MEVRLFATLREGRGKIFHIDWHEGIDGAAVLAGLGIKPDEVAMFMIDGANSKLDVKLKPNSIIAIFPPVGGG